MTSRISRGTAIVVEDDEALRRILEKALESNGYLTLTAEDGEQAMSLLANHTPKVVLLDINLPGISGLDVCKRVRANRLISAPIIFLTSENTPKVIRDCIEAGGDDFLIKGAEISSVLERVNYWAGGSNRRMSDRQRERALNETRSMIEPDTDQPAAARKMDGEPSGNADTVVLSHLSCVTDAYRRLSEKLPGDNDNSIVARIHRLGYLTGLVNGVSKMHLDVRLSFKEYLLRSMVSCGVAKNDEVDKLFKSLQDFYTNTTFADACDTAERDFRDLYPN